MSQTPFDLKWMKEYFGDENWFCEPERIESMNRLIREQWRGNGTGLADLAAEIASRGFDPLQQDGLHLNGRGHLLLAGMVARMLP